WISVGELLMTRRISLAAVCCSRASPSSPLACESSLVSSSILRAPLSRDDGSFLRLEETAVRRFVFVARRLTRSLLLSADGGTLCAFVFGIVAEFRLRFRPRRCGYGVHTSREVF